MHARTHHQRASLTHEVADPGGAQLGVLQAPPEGGARPRHRGEPLGAEGHQLVADEGGEAVGVGVGEAHLPLHVVVFDGDWWFVIRWLVRGEVVG